MRSTAQEVLDARKSGQEVRDHDLLAAMLKGIDPQTGQWVSYDSIINDLITFLVAGHDTTSGMLSDTFYHLLKNPETFTTQQEVDPVCGKGPVTLAHISKLGYINGALREALRIDSTIPTIGLSPVYGESSYEFKPELMTEESFNRLNREFHNCWKPFGNGKRSCIDMAFAWQETLIIMVVLLQNFDFTLEPNDYILLHKVSLTLKPGGLKKGAKLRDNLTSQALERRLTGSSTNPELPCKQKDILTDDQNMGVPMILYGSSTGSLPFDHPVVVVTDSYEGELPDDAERFVPWILTRQEIGKQFWRVSHAVFGCGNSEWVTSFHKIPMLVDTRLEELGAQRLAELGKTNISTGAAFTDFEVWEVDTIRPALKECYGTSGSATERSNLNVMNILKLTEIADNDKTIKLLGYPAGNGFNKEIVDKKVSILEVLERFPTLPIPPWLFLSMLSPMIIRQDNATITFSFLRKPSLSGIRLHIGAAASYLGRLGENDFIEAHIMSVCGLR
uniref:Flavodoxin-like domain-containing protein n=1 Tax=Bionectria ochroleuca TaxID=29856 RepID=A0A8H7TSX7_BIOOC